MIVEKEIPVVVDPDATNRCQHGTCRFAAVEGGTVCNIHGGNKQVASIRTQQLYDLSKTKWLAAQQYKMISNDQWRSVQEEIGILRVTLESTLNQCKDEKDLIRFSGQINNLIITITKSIESSLKLDKHLENLVGKEVMIAIAGDLIEAVYQEVQDPNLCERLGVRFKEILTRNRRLESS